MLLAYFDKLTRWDDCLRVVRETSKRVYFQRQKGKDWCPLESMDTTQFHQKYRIILAEDFVEEREKLLEIIFKK
jgi:hypothetical protein